MRTLYWDRNVYREETAALEALPESDGALILGVDLADPARAAVDVIEARRRGIRILVACVYADPLEALLARVGSQIAADTDAQRRRAHLAALRDGQLLVGGTPFASAAPPAREAAVALQFLTSMADAVGVFTGGEIARWASVLGKPLRKPAYLPVASLSAAPGKQTGITVYAPSTPRGMLGFIEAALGEKERDAVFISAENAGEYPQTSVVVVPEWWRPARALALAKAGFRVVCPSRSGVAARAAAFDYAELSADALAAALDAAASAAESGMLWEPAHWHPGTVHVPERAATVSIIVRTYDRPALLARALESIAHQTYSAVEIVVVNNGGPDCGDTVRRACGARPFKYVVHPERANISTASNLGARAATGAYVGYLDDDDLLYPDHVALAVEALERTGADVAYTDCAGEYAVVENGRKSVVGVGIYLDREFDRDSLYVSNFAPIHSIVHRRNLFDRFGYFDESLPVTDDWDLWLRAAHGARFVHVSRPTCEYSWRIDATYGNMTIRHQQDFVDAYKRITAHWAGNVGGREDIRQAQAQTLAMQEQRVAALAADPSRAFEVLLAPLLQNAVPVKGLLDDPNYSTLA